MSDTPFLIPETESQYVAFTRRAAGAIRRRFGMGMHATDIVHEVVLEVFEERMRTGSEAKGFWRRLTNKVFDNYRRDRAHQRMLARRLDQQREEGRKGLSQQAVEEKLIESELRGEIWRAIEELSKADQEIWRRLCVSESYAEIAAALGKSPEAVKQAAYRIRAHVRNRLPVEYRKGSSNDG